MNPENSEQAQMGRLAQALEAVYSERYGKAVARYIVECIAEGKDWSDVLPQLDVPPGGDPRAYMPEVTATAIADASYTMTSEGTYDHKNEKWLDE